MNKNNLNFLFFIIYARESLKGSFGRVPKLSEFRCKGTI